MLRIDTIPVDVVYTTPNYTPGGREERITFTNSSKRTIKDCDAVFRIFKCGLCRFDLFIAWFELDLIAE
jgi:hypothetical protein